MNSTRTGIDLEISGGHILTLDQGMTEINPGSVCISGNRIVYIGSTEGKPAEMVARTTINASGKIIMPTFFNCHNHAAMSMFRGLANDLSLDDWLNHFIWPAEKKYVNPETVYLGTMVSAMEMIRSGTSIFADMYFFEEEVARACDEIGMRVILGEGILDFPTPNKDTPNGAMDHTRILYSQFKDHPLITVSVSVHSPYICSPESIRKAADLSRELSLSANIHLAETRDEVTTIRERYGKSPVQYLFDLGFLSERTVAHHGIYLDDADISLLVQSGTHIATIPNSNMKLGSGLCRVPELISRGINVAIGTDGAASNNNQSLLRELQQLGRIQKVYHKDPTLLSAHQLISMATIHGARAYRMDQFLGSLETGKAADLMIINPDQPHWYPRYNVANSIAYTMHSEDVESVVINGEIVMHNRHLTRVDEEKILYRMKKLQLR
jgi:5-methylthioadenosine/S-adenosylhomocysteine deaminase